jgi:hypothetical protein
MNAAILLRHFSLLSIRSMRMQSPVKHEARFRELRGQVIVLLTLRSTIRSSDIQFQERCTLYK